MKQLLFLLLFGFLAVQVNAQKACCAKDAKAKTETSVKSVMLEADLVASNDENILREENAETGEVKYMRKMMDETSGETLYQEVVYNGKTKSFVNADPSIYSEGRSGEKAKCDKGAEGKACCAKKAKEGETSVQSDMKVKTKTKACSSKSSAKACCAKKAEKS